MGGGLTPSWVGSHEDHEVSYGTEDIEKDFLKGQGTREPGDLLRISRIIEPFIDKTANEIFLLYSKELLSKPITYIVPAVWGVKKEGELTGCQKEMHNRIAPVIDRVIKSLGIEGLSGAQQFAIGYLVRGYMISKITYMVENLKSKTYRRSDSRDGKEDIFNGKGTWGNA